MTPIDPEAIRSIARRLEHLDLVDVSSGMVTLDSDRLVSLSISTSDDQPVIAGLLRSHLPSLMKLTLRSSTDDYDDPDVAPQPLDLGFERAQLERAFPRAEVQLDRRSL
jgi:hypothetical protein